MALNSPPLESFSYTGFYDSYLDNGDTDVMSSFSSLLSNSGDNYASTTSNNCPYNNSVSPFLNLNPDEECNLWIDTMNQNNSNYNHVSKYQNNEMMNGCSLMINGAIGEKKCGENGRFVFPYPSSSHIDYVQESLKQEKISRKRSYEGVEMQTSNQQCEIERKTKAKSLSPSKAKSVSPSKEKSLSPSKEKSLSPSKDPQSHAAKIRRERISERLKVLQELVPNGTKVDLVTMLEKAISYVKFLQLQVKVLATDEFWPAQGGTAPDISQVKEALDAILSSNKQRSSSPEKSEN